MTHAARGCPACLRTGYVQFRWDTPDKGEAPEFEGYRNSIVLYRRLRAGALHRCLACDADWYFDEPELMMHHVPAGREPLVENWAREPLVPPPILQSALQKIGGSGADYYGNWREFEDYPCACTTRTGAFVDHCVVRFQVPPPIFSYQKQIFLISEIQQIEPSRFALSKALRDAVLAAEERRMGFYPTIVADPRGRRYCLNGRTYFFQIANQCGSELSLARAAAGETPMLVYEDFDSLTWIIADRMTA